mgnify:FL=1
MIRLFFLLLVTNTIYASEADRVLFNKLRERHTGSIAAKSFVADMDKKSAAYLLKDKIKGTYVVKVNYNNVAGVNLTIQDTESFYKNILSSYAIYINTMLLPLLSNTSYTRLQKRFLIKHVKANTFQLTYNKGDIPIKYIFSEGNLGLIDHIQYFEQEKKNFVLTIKWKKIQDYYVPILMKGVSYENTRQTLSFGIENIQLK